VESKEDITRIIIKDGIDDIYELFAEGEISKEAAHIRLIYLLDSKGVMSFFPAAYKIVKDWKR